MRQWQPAATNDTAASSSDAGVGTKSTGANETGAGTTSSGTNGASSATDNSVGPAQGFVSVDPLAAPAIEGGTAFEVEIPVTAFRHTDANAQITLKVELADGSSLPSWMSFDPVRNVLSGSAPSDVSAVSVVVTASDQRGAEIKASINLQFGQ